MRKTLSCAAMALMIALAWNANGTPAAQEKTPPKKTATRKKARRPRKSAGDVFQQKGRRHSQKGHQYGVRTQARDHHQERVLAGQEGSRQTGHLAQPANDAFARSLPRDSGRPGIQRFSEIRKTLREPGTRRPSDALKKFQSEQNLESTGKINSLSLIALGLGPKRETASAAPPKPVPPPPPGQ